MAMRAQWFHLPILALALLVGTSARASAFEWGDTGWKSYGTTAHAREFKHRAVNIQLDQNQSGLIYIHKGGQVTRGDKYPYLPFGLTTSLLWERNGLFDLTVGEDKQYLYYHLSALPEFEYLEKGINRLVLKVIFPCGDDGEVSLIVSAAAGQPYLDMTLDLTEFRRKDEPISLVLRCIPSHNGKVDGRDLPLNRMVRSAAQPGAVPNGKVAVASDQPWLLLYDQQIAKGSCGLLADPRAVADVSVAGQRRLNVQLDLKPGADSCRFYLWEFPARTASLEDAVAYFQNHSEQLADSLIKGRSGSRLANVWASYQAVQVSSSVELNGRLDDEAWGKMEWSESFRSLQQGNPMPEDLTRFKVAYDTEHLYLAIRSDESVMADLKTVAADHDSDAVFSDDSIELFISPQNTAVNYLHLAFNAAGVKHDAIHSVWQGGGRHLDWDPMWDVAVDTDDTGWTAEVRLPFDQLLLTESVNETWMLNIARNDRAGKSQPGYVQYQTWTHLVGSFHQPEVFNELTGINLDLSAAMDPEGFAAHDMIAPRRSDHRSVMAHREIEVIKEGSNEFYLYYPHKEIYLPADGTPMRTVFNFKETRRAYTELWRTANHGADATRKYAEQVAFHFLLPEGVRVASDHAFLRGAYMEVDRIDDRHVILRPLYPPDHGGLWSSLYLDRVPIFLQHSLSSGMRLPIDSWVEYQDTGETSSVVRSYLNIVEFPQVEPIDRFVIDPFWQHYSDFCTFPNYLPYLKRVGFNSFAVFVGDLLDDTGRQMTSYDQAFAEKKRRDILRHVNQAREMGLSINLWDSTFNRFGLHSSIGRWGQTRYADPFYTGELYWYDIKNVTDAYEIAGGADLVTMDIEVFKRVTEPKFGFFEKSPEDAARVRRMAEKKGTSIEDIFTDVGTRMLRDIRSKLSESDDKLGITGQTPFVVWNVVLDEQNPMEGLFDGHKVFPDYVQYLNPHVYDAGRDMRSAGTRVRFHVLESGSRQVIACATFSYKIDYTYEQVRDQLLEIFYNGAMGVQYWPGDFDQNDAYGQLLALREIAPVQDILAEGELHVQTPDIEAPTQVVGVVRDGAAAILVSNYQDAGPTRVQVRNPIQADTSIYDLETRAKLADVKAGQTVEVVLDQRRAKTFYFGPDREMD